MVKYKNKNRKSVRLHNWNYGDDASYFITICTSNRICHFGNIVISDNHDRAMNLSEIGKMVELEWLKSFEFEPK